MVTSCGWSMFRPQGLLLYCQLEAAPTQPIGGTKQNILWAYMVYKLVQHFSWIINDICISTIPVCQWHRTNIRCKVRYLHEKLIYYDLVAMSIRALSNQQEVHILSNWLRTFINNFTTTLGFVHYNFVTSQSFFIRVHLYHNRRRMHVN